MLNLEKFYTMLGKSIMFCQIIEHDVKRIYVSMLKGNYFQNLDAVNRWTLGQTLTELQRLDNSDNHPLLSPSDYKLLFSVTEKRNHICHQSCLNFMYDKDFLHSAAYADECARISSDYEMLNKIYLEVEDARVKAQKLYRPDMF